MEPENEQETVEQPKQTVDVGVWIKRFKQSERVMKSEFRWKYIIARARLRAEHEVKHRNTKKMTHEQVNLVQSIGTNYVNSVYFKAPTCNLTAREEVDHERIENTEIKVNDWLKDNKVKKVVRRNVWDAFLGGFGARFIDHEYEDVEDPNNVIQPEQIDQMGQVIPPVLGRIVLKNEIIIHRIRPDLVRFPRGFDFDNYQESPWIGFDIIHPLEYVKNNQAWDETVRERIEGEKYSKLTEFDEKQSSTDEETDDLYVKISYVFQKPDINGDPFKLLVFCHSYSDAPLQDVEYDKGHVGYPVKFLYHNPLDDDRSYPSGDCWNMESQFAAIDTWWKKMVRHVERSNPKRVYDSKVISQQEAQKLKQNNDNEWIGINNKSGIPIPNLIQTLESPAVHPDTSSLFEVARQLVSEIGPKSGLTRGATDSKPDTATEAKIIATGEVIDIEARIDDVREYIVDIVLDVAGILGKMEAPVMIQKPIMDEVGQPMLGPDRKPMTQSMEVNKEGFTSKVNVDVDVESMQAQNKDVFRRQLLDSLQFLVKFEPMMNKVGKTLDPLFWLERIMETMNIRNVEKGVIDLPPMPVPVPMPGQGPEIAPSESTGAMPPEAIEARLGQMA